MTDIYRLGKSYKKISDGFTRVLTVVMAILLMVYSAFNIWLQLEYDAYAGDLVILIPLGLSFVIALLSLFIKRIDAIRLVGVYALILGFHRFYLRVLTTDWDADPVGSLISILFILLALRLMFSGISFARGKVVKRRSMMITTMIMVVIELVTSEIAGNFADIYPELIYPLVFYKLCLVSMYVCLIGLLDSELIRDSTKDAKYANAINAFRNEHRYDQGAAITSEEANALTDYSSHLWKPGPGGPVESELNFVVRGYSTQSYVVVQRWRGDDRLFFTVHGKPGSILFGNRFAVDRIDREKGAVHLIGKDGTDAVLWVRD